MKITNKFYYWAVIVIAILMVIGGFVTFNDGEAATLSQVYEKLKKKYPETIEKLKEADPQLKDTQIESFVNDLSNQLISQGNLTKKNIKEKFFNATMEVMLSGNHNQVVNAAIKGFNVTWDDINNKRIPAEFEPILKTIRDELLDSPSSSHSSGGSNSNSSGSTGENEVTREQAPESELQQSQTTQSADTREERQAVVFSDIKGHWAEKDIMAMAARGIVKGSNGMARPEERVTRAQFATFLVNMLDISETAGSLSFTDADSTAWYSHSLSAAYRAGLISGYGNGRIGPDDYITREQIAVMVIKAYKYAGKGEVVPSGSLSFKDSGEISGWASNSVSAAFSLGIIRGLPDNTFRPGATATRAEALVMLARLVEKL